jgi:5-formyltetrahydrofolate cyclo-ligase
MALPQWLEAQTVLLYHSLPDEVCTHALIDSALQQHKRVLLPVVVGEELELHQYTDHGALQEGAFHILEPQGPTFTDYAAIDLAVIPGVAFTTDGKRLGRGKGYYDRLLPRTTAHRIGLCFHFQLLDDIPTTNLDATMDEIVTDEEHHIIKQRAL